MARDACDFLRKDAGTQPESAATFSSSRWHGRGQSPVLQRGIEDEGITDEHGGDEQMSQTMTTAEAVKKVRTLMIGGND